MTEPSDVSPNSANAGDIAGEYLALLLGHWPRLLTLSAIGWGLLLVANILQGMFLGYTPKDLLIFFDLELLPIAFVTAAVAHATLWGTPGDPVRACLDVASRAFIPVLIVTCLVRLAAVVGLVVLVIPGLAAMILLGLSAVIIMAERPMVLEALRLSAVRVWKNLLAVLISYLVYILSLAFFTFAGAFIAAILAAFVPGALDQFVMGSAISAMMSVSHTVFAVAIYRALARGAA